MPLFGAAEGLRETTVEALDGRVVIDTVQTPAAGTFIGSDRRIRWRDGVEVARTFTTRRVVDPEDGWLVHAVDDDLTAVGDQAVVHNRVEIQRLVL